MSCRADLGGGEEEVMEPLLLEHEELHRCGGGDGGAAGLVLNQCSLTEVLLNIRTPSNDATVMDRITEGGLLV